MSTPSSALWHRDFGFLGWVSPSQPHLACFDILVCVFSWFLDPETLYTSVHPLDMSIRFSKPFTSPTLNFRTGQWVLQFQLVLGYANVSGHFCGRFHTFLTLPASFRILNVSMMTSSITSSSSVSFWEFLTISVVFSGLLESFTMLCVSVHTSDVSDWFLGLLLEFTRRGITMGRWVRTRSKRDEDSGINYRLFIS